MLLINSLAVAWRCCSTLIHMEVVCADSSNYRNAISRFVPHRKTMRQLATSGKKKDDNLSVNSPSDTITRRLIPAVNHIK